MACHQAAHDRCFAARAKRRGLAGARHLLDDFRALDQQILKCVVNAIQFGPQAGKFRSAGGSAPRQPSFGDASSVAEAGLEPSTVGAGLGIVFPSGDADLADAHHSANPFPVTGRGGEP